MKELAMATALALVVTSGVALAQENGTAGSIGPGAAANNTMPPASYKGPGGMMRYKGSDYVSNVQPSAETMPPAGYKGPGGMMRYKGSDYVSNVQPSAGGGMPPKSYKGPGGMMSYNGADYSHSTQGDTLYDQSRR